MIFLCFPYVSSDSTLRLFHLLFINLQTRFTRFSSKQWCSWNDYILFFENNSIVYWQKWIDKEATWFLLWDYLFRDPWFDASFGERDKMWYQPVKHDTLSIKGKCRSWTLLRINFDWQLARRPSNLVRNVSVICNVTPLFQWGVKNYLDYPENYVVSCLRACSEKT